MILLRDKIFTSLLRVSPTERGTVCRSFTVSVPIFRSVTSRFRAGTRMHRGHTKGLWVGNPSGGRSVVEKRSRVKGRESSVSRDPFLKRGIRTDDTLVVRYGTDRLLGG